MNAKKLRERAVISAILLFVLCQISCANIITLDLFSIGCQSTYDINLSSWSSDFDLGVEFSQIDHVYIDWAGEIRGMSVINYSGTPPYDPISADAGFLAHIGPYPPTQRAQVWGGAASYPNPESFDAQSEFQFLSEGNWNSLLDGKESIRLYHSIPVTPPEVDIIDYGTTYLDKAVLVIDGVIVPEPTSVLFITLGVLGIRIKR